MPVPDQQMWLRIAKDYEYFWNFPHCVGSVDGKHVLLQAPANSGSQFINFKKTFSIVLLAVVYAQYNFVVADVGAYGRQSECSVLKNSVFGQKLLKNELDLPQERPLNGTTTPNMPFVFVGDNTFPLTPKLMRPYPGRYLSEDRRIFN